MARRSIIPLVVVLGVVAALGVAAIAQGDVALTPQQQLGKSIFFDDNLSVNQNQSCATCHAPEAGWVGPDAAINEAGAVYEGSIAGAFGDRKPPSSAYATFAPVLHLTKGGLFVGGNFWDGRATGYRLGSPAAEQAQGPFLNPKEQALPDAATVVYRVATARGYPVSFAHVWGWDPATAIAWPADEPWEFTLVGRAYDEIAFSIAAYEGSAESNAFSSKYDAWKAGKTSLTKQETKGWALFNGKAKCAKCHTPRATGGNAALFTDFTYDNLGIPANLQNPVYDYAPDFVDPGLGGFLATSADYATYAAANLGKHKVPTLRNVDLRPNEGFLKAYGHNGYFKSLEEIVHFYNTRDVPGAGWMGQPWPAPEVAQNVNTAELGNLGLTAEDEAALVAFMRTLSDGWMQ